MKPNINTLKFELIFKKDLNEYLRSHDKVDERFPEAPDLEELWDNIAQTYLLDAMREFNDYPTVALGWIMYVGMAVAKYWDEDWEVYSKVENLYVYLRDKTDFDHTDDYIREKVLLLSKAEADELERLVGECAARTYSQLRRLHVEPSTPEAYHAFVAALHQLYLFGVAVELKALGYRMTAIN